MFRFPWGDMHSLNLGWFLQKFNELREDWATAEAGIDGALDAEIQRAEDALSDVFDARDAAAASATAAAGSASAANTSKTAAQNSATAAASSATLANQKATAAGLSEAAAAQSATAASNSASAAATSATQAGNSAAAAQSSAAAAAASEAHVEEIIEDATTEAIASATQTATTAATNAANSATAAGNSATAAAGSATAAAGSATAAAGSATAAEESADDAAASAETLSGAIGIIDFYKKFLPSVYMPAEKLSVGTVGNFEIYGNIIEFKTDNPAAQTVLMTGLSAISATYTPTEQTAVLFFPAGSYQVEIINLGKEMAASRAGYFWFKKLGDSSSAPTAPFLNANTQHPFDRSTYTITLTEGYYALIFNRLAITDVPAGIAFQCNIIPSGLARTLSISPLSGAEEKTIVTETEEKE